jgi:microcystin-dependent protein
MQAKALALRRQGTFPTVFVSVFVLALSAGPAWPQAEPFLGQAMTTANSSCPKGWSVMAGQTLPINQNQALFALLGTRFGGNGQTTFALPKARLKYTANGNHLTQCIAIQGIFPSPY